MAELKDKKSKINSVVKNVPMDIECVVFLKLNRAYDPSKIVYRILEDAERTKVPKTRHCARITPIQEICKADLDAISSLKNTLVKTYFHDKEQTTFCVQYSTRNYQGSLERDNVIKLFASMISRRHKVDLKNPVFTILIEVYKGICCISIVRDYQRFKKYNIASILGTNANRIKISERNMKEKESKENEKDENNQNEIVESKIDQNADNNETVNENINLEKGENNEPVKEVETVNETSNFVQNE